jgi:hypothetical protein
MRAAHQNTKDELHGRISALLSERAKLEAHVRLLQTKSDLGDVESHVLDAFVERQRSERQALEDLRLEYDTVCKVRCPRPSVRMSPCHVSWRVTVSLCMSLRQSAHTLLQNYFLSFALQVKMNQSCNGKIVNVNVHDLYDESIQGVSVCV